MFGTLNCRVLKFWSWVLSIIVYRGYAAEVDFNPDKCCLAGKVTGIEQDVFFYATNLSELKVEFHRSIDLYLSGKAQLGNKQGNDKNSNA